MKVVLLRRNKGYFCWRVLSFLTEIHASFKRIFQVFRLGEGIRQARGDEGEGKGEERKNKKKGREKKGKRRRRRKRRKSTRKAEERRGGKLHTLTVMLD